MAPAKPVKRKPSSPKKKPALKKPKRHAASGDLSEKTVVQLRKIASSKKVKQTNPDGSTKRKAQLISAIKAK